MKEWHEGIGDSLGKGLERPAKVLGREQANGLVNGCVALAVAIVAAAAINTVGGVLTSPLPSKIVKKAALCGVGLLSLAVVPTILQFYLRSWDTVRSESNPQHRVPTPPPSLP
jgi:hypothetical protein